MICKAATIICAVIAFPASALLADEPVGKLDVGAAIELGEGKDAYQRFPAVAFGQPAGGKEAGVFLVVWQDGWNGEGGDSNILGLRISADGKDVLDPKPIAICMAKGIQEAPAVSWDGKHFVVVWSDLRNGTDNDIYAALVGVNGKVAKSDIRVCCRERTQCCPKVASCGEVSLVVWQDLRDGQNYRVFAARVDAAGEVLDKDGLDLCNAPSAMPAVGASGEQFLVVYAQTAGIFSYVGGARVGKDGAVVGKPLANHAFRGGGGAYPGVASDGKDFLFICGRRQPPNYWGWGGPSSVEAARVLADGATPDVTGIEKYKWNLDPPTIDIGSAYKGQNIWVHWYSSVAWDGKEYVAVWTRCRQKNTVNLLNSDVFATRIRFPGWRKLDSPTGPIPADANAMKTPPSVGVSVADTPDYETMPAVTAGAGGKLLIVYETQKPDGAILVTAKALTAP